MSGGFIEFPELCGATDIGTNTGTSRGTTVNTGAANTLGSYTQLVASTAADTCAMIIMPGTGSGGTHNCAWDIAIGGAGSETVIAQAILATGPTNPVISCYLVPCNIPAGTRISARVQGDASDTGGAAPAISVILLDGSYQTEGAAGVDTIGFVSASTRGTTVTGGAANTKGSYAQLIASTARDYVGFILAPDGLNAGVASNMLLDIAIGASGSETIILPNYAIGGQGTQSPRCFALNGVLPIPIPAGSRIAARLQDAIGSAAIGLTLYGIYK